MVDVSEALRLLHETHIEASLTYDERRFTLLQSYLIGLTAVYGFWFNMKDRERRAALFAPLVFFTVIATFFSAYLTYVYSRDSHTYFIYAEKMIRQVYDIDASGEATQRAFFGRMWDRAHEQFWQDKAVSVLFLWVAPIVVYSGALLTAAYRARRAEV